MHAKKTKQRNKRIPATNLLTLPVFPAALL
jgi:hypothetical protein